MRHFTLLLTLLALTSCNQNTGDNTSIISINVTNDIVLPEYYIVAKTNSPIQIDGIADEKSWQNAFYTKPFIDIEGVKVPKFKTQAKMLWDDDFLYVFAKIEEPHIWGNITQRDAIIYLNNDFEIFIDPSNTGFGYGEIEINALNTVWDLYLDKPYRVGGKANFNWNLDQLRSAVFIDGTINSPNDLDNYWSIEIAIPLKPLVNLKNRPKSFPKEGEQWHLNFSRVEWDFDIIDSKYQRKKIENKLLKEHNWVWSNQKVINMHEPEKWGVIQFTEKESASNVKYLADQDLLIKQCAYALFRKTKFKDLKHLLKTPTNTIKELKVYYSNTDSIKAHLFKTNLGFEYKIKSPKSNYTYIINEQGQLKKI